MPGKQSTKKRVMNEQSDSASQRVPVAAQDPQMTADNFEGEIEKAESKIQELRNTVIAYAKRYTDAFGEGGSQLLVTKMLEDEQSARESLRSAVETFRTGATADIPVEKTLEFLAQSMERLERVLSSAQQLDASSAIPENLRKQISSFYDYAHTSIDRARGVVNDIQARTAQYQHDAKEYASEKVTQVEHAVKRNQTIQTAYTAIEDLRIKVVEHEAFHGAQEILQRASEELSHSVDQLRQVPASEIPMAAVLESLKLGRNAVNTVAEIIQNSETSQRVSQPVLEKIQSAKQFAADAIRYAVETFNNFRGKAWTYAESAEAYALSKAVEMDKQYDVLQKTRQLASQVDERYNVSGTATSLTKYAQDVIQSYQLDQTAEKALNSACELDSHYTGGRVCDLVNWAIETGKTHADYLQQEFNNQRKEVPSSQ